MLVAPILATHCDTVRAMELEEEISLLPNFKELWNGANVVGPPHVRYIGGLAPVCVATS